MTDKTTPLVWIVRFRYLGGDLDGYQTNFSAHSNKADAEAELDIAIKGDDGEDEGRYEIFALKFNPVRTGE